jgi:hypothetical protein
MREYVAAVAEIIMMQSIVTRLIFIAYLDTDM